MKKVKSTPNELRAEYKRSDFKKLERGKYYERIRASSNVVVLDPEVAAAFPNSAAVNKALHSLLEGAESVSGLSSGSGRRARTGEVPDEELLLPYEREMVTGEFRTYFKAARQCWLATINHFPELWRLFVQLDDIFIREFLDCEKQQNEAALLPLTLFIKAHKSIRVAAELAFSTHFSEAYDATRAAIEAAVFAHKIYREPGMALVWLQRDHGEAEKKAFESAFVFYKEKNLFPNTIPFLVKLYKVYGYYSEWGTHTTLTSVGLHYHGHEDEGTYRASIAYVGADLQLTATIIETLIDAFWQIEKALHDAFSSRLSLDDALERMRATFEAGKRNIAAALTTRFGIKGPLIIPP